MRQPIEERFAEPIKQLLEALDPNDADQLQLRALEHVFHHLAGMVGHLGTAQGLRLSGHCDLALIQEAAAERQRRATTTRLAGEKPWWPEPYEFSVYPY